MFTCLARDGACSHRASKARKALPCSPDLLRSVASFAKSSLHLRDGVEEPAPTERPVHLSRPPSPPHQSTMPLTIVALLPFAYPSRMGCNRPLSVGARHDENARALFNVSLTHYCSHATLSLCRPRHDGPRRPGLLLLRRLLRQDVRRHRLSRRDAHRDAAGPVSIRPRGHGRDLLLRLNVRQPSLHQSCRHNHRTILRYGIHQRRALRHAVVRDRAVHALRPAGQSRAGANL